MPQIEPVAESPPFPQFSPGEEETDPVAGPAVTAETAARAAAITAHLGDASDAHDASAVSVAPLTSLVGADVQAVLTDADARFRTVESRSLLFIQDTEPVTDSTALWIAPGGGIYVQVEEA